MSKLEEQKALPRRRLFSMKQVSKIIRDEVNATMDKIAGKPKRKAKKADGHALMAQLKWTVEDADRMARSAEITKFQTQSVAIRRGRKLTKRKAKKAKRKP